MGALLRRRANRPASVGATNHLLESTINREPRSRRALYPSLVNPKLKQTKIPFKFLILSILSSQPLPPAHITCAGRSQASVQRILASPNSALQYSLLCILTAPSSPSGQLRVLCEQLERTAICRQQVKLELSKCLEEPNTVPDGGITSEDIP